MTEWLNWEWVVLICFVMFFAVIAYAIKLGND